MTKLRNVRSPEIGHAIQRKIRRIELCRKQIRPV